MSQPTGFVEYLCANYPRILVFHVLLWFGTFINSLSFLVVDLPRGARAVAVMNYVGLAGMLLGTGLVLVVCREEWTWSRE